MSKLEEITGQTTVGYGASVIKLYGPDTYRNNYEATLYVDNHKCGAIKFTTLEQLALFKKSIENGDFAVLPK